MYGACCKNAFGDNLSRMVVAADCTECTASVDCNYLSTTTRLSGNEVGIGGFDGGNPAVTKCVVSVTDDICLPYHEGDYNFVTSDAALCTHVMVE